MIQKERNMENKTYSIPIYKVSLVRDSKVKTETNPKVTRSVDLIPILRSFLEGTDREHFIVVLLDVKNRIIGLNEVSVGSLSMSIVHPREVFKPAILSNAAGIVLAHNHPSGDPAPSQEDKAVTIRMREVGEVMGIRVLDHIVLGDGTNGYFSFLDSGLW